MVGESRKWMVLVATTWIQAFTGTNFNFSSYSTDLKSVLGISQVQLNYVSVASDVGKAFGWCSGIALMYFPVWVVMFVAAFMGLAGYGLQWLLIQNIITLPYSLVLLLSLMAGCSICWFNTVCYVLCIKNFPSANRSLALSLGISFNGVSAAIYNLIANSIDPNDSKLYLLLNAVIPLTTSVIAFFLIIHHSSHQAPSPDTTSQDSVNFLHLTALAIITGLYLLVFNSVQSNASAARFVLTGAIFLLALPLVKPGIVNVWKQASNLAKFSVQLGGTSFTLIDNDNLEIHEELMGTETQSSNDFCRSDESYYLKEEEDSCNIELGEEHSTWLLIRKWDFWLYYVAYFCGGTLGLVYSNNLGQISETLGYRSDVNSLVSLYSACSFFGRLLSTSPDFLRDKMHYARTGWLALALVPTPIAFLLLVSSGSKTTLITATSLIGLSSGFVFSTAVSITSELFGPNNAGVNHNILITNIPLGSLLYSLLAALVYEENIGNSIKAVSRDGESMVCFGRDCFHKTFVWWSWISLLGLTSSLWLFLRTRATYARLEKQNHGIHGTLLKSFSSYNVS